MPTLGCYTKSLQQLRSLRLDNMATSLSDTTLQYAVGALVCDESLSNTIATLTRPMRPILTGLLEVISGASAIKTGRYP